MEERDEREWRKIRKTKKEREMKDNENLNRKLKRRNEWRKTNEESLNVKQN